MDPETGRRTPSYPKMPKNACPKKFFGSNFSKISWTRGGVQFSPNLFTRPGLKLKLGPQHKNVTELTLAQNRTPVYLQVTSSVFKLST